MTKRCLVVGCNKIAVTKEIPLCKNHICRCNLRCCKVHDKTGKWIEDIKLKNGDILISKKGGELCLT